MSENDVERYAAGWPGISPRWTSSAKTGIGTALNLHSRVWFTLSHGILNEVYFPRVDQACTRDLGLIVTDGSSFFSEEKRHCKFKNQAIEPGVPVYQLTNTELQGATGSRRKSLPIPTGMSCCREYASSPSRARLRTTVSMLCSRLIWRTAAVKIPAGSANTKACPPCLPTATGWLWPSPARSPGARCRWASLDSPTAGRTCRSNFQLTWDYTRAENGNVALTGEIDLVACNGEFVLALGFGGIWSEAGQEARSTLLESYDQLREHYVWHWKDWQDTLLKLDEPRREVDLYRASAAVLRSHESKDFLGGVIASLSIPWGFNKGDEDLGGYHLVWPRDLVETACGFLAAGAEPDALRVLRYLEVTQEADGTLGAEHVARRASLLERPADGRGGVSHSAGGSAASRALVGFVLGDLQALVADGEPRRRVHRPQWPGHAAGPLGRGRGLFAVHPGGGDIAALLAAADLADAVSASTTSRPTCARLPTTWNDNIERWTYATRQRPRPAGRRGRLLRSHRAPGFGLARLRRSRGSCPSRTGRRGERIGRRRT